MTLHEVSTELLLVDQDGIVFQATPGVSGLLGLGTRPLVGRSLSEIQPTLAILHDEIKTHPERAHSQTLWLNHPCRRLQATVSLLSGTPKPTYSVMLVQREREKLQETQATIEAIISGFAHEVRNPLAAILSITEAAMSQLDPSLPATRMVERIPGLVGRVDKLLKQSQLYGRPRPPQRTTTKVEQVFGWALEMARAERSRVEVQVEVSREVDAILVDAEQIEQVLVNLLCNAQDAARSRVSLSARQDGSSVLLEVSDDGTGIEEHHRAKIFEPFYTTKAHGTGLGLAIARNLARLNGGELTLLRSSTQGTTFRLCLEASHRATATTKAA